jgi:endo-1,4-beta-D-glucanase Y
LFNFFNLVKPMLRAIKKLCIVFSLIFFWIEAYPQINTPAGAGVPFRTNSSYNYGLMPTNLPSGGVYGNSQHAADAYNTWKTNYVELCSGAPVKYRVRFDNPSETVSEGIGYGMLLAAYAADKALFDGLWEYYKSFDNNNGLMNWKVNGCASVIGSGSATDADLDAALALRIAIEQWPSDPVYPGDLNTLLADIRTNDIQAAISVGPFQTNNGDSWGQSNTCRNLGYQSPAYYKVFANYETGQIAFWNNAAHASNLLINANVNTSTGLVSNWCDVNGTPNTCNGPNEYGWDACRFPWRMATAVIWWNDSTALTCCANLAAYVQSTGVSNLKGPVSQSGGVGSYHSPAFVSTWACGLLGSNSSYQSTLNAAYSEAVNTVDALPYYFGNTLRVLALFQMTGNFWNPVSITTNMPSISMEIYPQIEIYPNPSHGVFKISFQSPYSNNYQLNIYNVLTELIYSENTDSPNKMIDLTKVPKGLCFIEVIQRDQIIKRKILIE